MHKLLLRTASERLPRSEFCGPIYRWARAGQLASIQFGRRQLFTQIDLQGFVNQARVSSEASVPPTALQ